MENLCKFVEILRGKPLQSSARIGIRGYHVARSGKETRLQMDGDKQEKQATLPAERAVSELLHEWIAAFNAHDVMRLVALYTEDAELCDTGMKHPRKGRNEITAWFTERFRGMPTIQYTPTRFFLQESEAGICWISKGRTPPLLRQRWLSRPFEVDGVSIFLLQGGLICWQHGYYDHLRVAEGVIPPLRWLPLRQ